MFIILKVRVIEVILSLFIKIDKIGMKLKDCIIRVFVSFWIGKEKDFFLNVPH